MLHGNKTIHVFWVKNNHSFFYLDLFVFFFVLPLAFIKGDLNVVKT